jgi:predicted RNase H-like nuclease
MSRIAAVLGSKAGWFVLRETPLPGPWSWFVTDTFEEAMQRLEGHEVVTVAAPLCLPEMDSPPAGEQPEIPDPHQLPVEKVREVHDFVGSNARPAHALYEVRPNLSFCELHGDDDEMQQSGRRLRFLEKLSYLCDVYPSEALYDAMTTFRPADVSREDVLDAFAMLWSAKRIATSRAERVPARPVYSASGSDVAVWY